MHRFEFEQKIIRTIYIHLAENTRSKPESVNFAPRIVELNIHEFMNNINKNTKLLFIYYQWFKLNNKLKFTKGKKLGKKTHTHTHKLYRKLEFRTV